MSSSKIIELISARATSDGAGVKLLRVFGGAGPERFDPFLMLDEFGSVESADYIGGFPSHPHRGFETITYMLEGKMEHQDHMGNVGLLNDGDVQWMTAGRGIIHSEMPKQTEGKMRGFQLWLNLAADKKMVAAHYQDVAHKNLPRFSVGDVEVIAIAGQGQLNGVEIQGYFDRPDTQPLLWDIHVGAGVTVDIPSMAGLNAMMYVYENALNIGETRVSAQKLARLTPSNQVVVSNNTEWQSRFLLIAGRPLKQPIVQYGPFVMNTAEQIEQALQDYREGALTA